MDHRDEVYTTVRFLTSTSDNFLTFPKKIKSAAKAQGLDESRRYFLKILPNPHQNKKNHRLKRGKWAFTTTHESLKIPDRLNDYVTKIQTILANHFATIETSFISSLLVASFIRDGIYDAMAYTNLARIWIIFGQTTHAIDP